MSVQELTDKLMLTQIEKLIEAAVLAEREACAKLCDRGAEHMTHVYKRDGAARCAAAIRARGE